MARRIHNRRGTGGTQKEVADKFVQAVLTLAPGDEPVLTRDVISVVWPELNAEECERLKARILNMAKVNATDSVWRKVTQVDVVAPGPNGVNAQYTAWRARRTVRPKGEEVLGGAVGRPLEVEGAICDHEWRFNGGNPVCSKCGSYKGEFVQRVFPAARVPVTMQGVETIIAVPPFEVESFDIIGTDLGGDHLLRRASDGAIGKFVRI